MGWQLAPTFANIFMHHIENKNINELKESGVIEWLGYVDENFVQIRSVTELISILEFLKRSTHLSNSHLS